MSRSAATCWDCGEIVGFGSVAILRCGVCAPDFEHATGGLDPNRFYDESTLFSEALDDFLSSDELMLLRNLLEPTGGAFNDVDRWRIDQIREKLAVGNVVEIHKNMTVR